MSVKPLWRELISLLGVFAAEDTGGVAATVEVNVNELVVNIVFVHLLLPSLPPYLFL